MPNLKKIDMNGVGKIFIDKGKLSSLDISFNGIGSIDAQKCEVEDVKVDANGLGRVKVWATKRLEMAGSELAKISYKGKPEVIKKEPLIFKSTEPIVTQERTVSNFTGVSHETIGDVKIHFAADYKVTVTVAGDLQKFITTEVHDGILKIDMLSDTGSGSRIFKGLTIDVYMPELKKIELSAPGDIYVDEGKVSNLDISVSGVGTIHAQKCEAENVNVTLSGLGTVKVWAAKYLHAALLGRGKIKYKGNPNKLIEGEGLGKIEKL